tara:strand:- start:294 stop:590 length:297 start_codon:yes stop_codon:yes gene_type:complete
MTNNTVLLAEKEDELDCSRFTNPKDLLKCESEKDKEFFQTVAAILVTPAIIVFILFTYLGWFQWNKDTGLRKIIKAIIQFIFSIIIGFIVLLLILPLT